MPSLNRTEQTITTFNFPDLPGASADLVRVRATEPITYRREGRNGQLVEGTYTLDENVLLLSRMVVGRENIRPHESFLPIREGSDVGQAVDGIHLPTSVLKDEAALLATVREQIALFLA